MWRFVLVLLAPFALGFAGDAAAQQSDTVVLETTQGKIEIKKPGQHIIKPTLQGKTPWDLCKGQKRKGEHGEKHLWRTSTKQKNQQ